MNYIVKSENAIYYECGYSSDNALFLVCGDERFFITDSRYTVEALEQVMVAEVITSRDLIKSARTIFKKAKIKKLHFDPKEWSVDAFAKLSKNSNIIFVKSPDFSHKKRVIKSEREIELLSRAVTLGKNAFEALALEINKRGFEENEHRLTYDAQTILSNYGTYDLSFNPIIAINANSAKPHALTTSQILNRDDLLLVDAGLKYKRYCSDRTRTVFANQNFTFEYEQRFSDAKIQKAYDTVLMAHDKAISKARSGMKAKKIDALARDVIEKAGFGSYFVHSTGHGVGLDIHEMPYISSKNDMIIEDGMVYTIEPGIYIPTKFGIRIEDMVVMHSGKARVL